MCYFVLGPYDAPYIRVGTFFGARERKNGIVGTIAEPRTHKEADLLDTYTTALRSQNSQVAKFTYGVNFGEFPFHALG